MTTRKTQGMTQRAPGLAGIITGDLVGSRRLDAAERRLVLAELENLLTQHGSQHALFRGDGFQALLAKPSDGLRVALLIRATLMGMELPKQPKGLDARIGLGMGPIDFPADTLGKSDGLAFRRAAEALEAADEKQRLGWRSGESAVDAEWAVSLPLLEALISRWSMPQAQAVAQRLIGRTQTEAAKALGISQSAVNQALKAARWDPLPALLERFEQQVNGLTAESA